MRAKTDLKVSHTASPGHCGRQVGLHFAHTPQSGQKAHEQQEGRGCLATGSEEGGKSEAGARHVPAAPQSPTPQLNTTALVKPAVADAKSHGRCDLRAGSWRGQLAPGLTK